jgi:lipopolysaccharide transport system ATP-binding protein
MDAVARAGRTVLFVSHSMSTVEALCDRAIWLQRGRVVAEGSPAGVVQGYLEASATAQAAPLEERQDRSGDGTARIVSLAVESADGQGIIRPGSRLRISVGYRSQRPLRNAQFVLAVYDHLDAGLFLLHSDFTTPLPETLPPEGVVVCETEPIGVTAGRCVLHAELLQGNVRSDKVPRAVEFDIQDVDVFGSGMVPPRSLVRYVVGHRWTVEPSGDGRGV